MPPTERPERHERPDLSTEAGRLAFNGILNERLPKTRAIAQGILRNPTGELLVCELTYKQEWDLPGGVVDPHESPATCLEREVREELGLDVTAGRLLAVNWLPPYRGWDDALQFLFDLGTIDPDVLDPANFLTREIKGVHWVRLDRLGEHLAPYAARLVERTAVVEHPVYLEDGRAPTSGAEA